MSRKFPLVWALAACLTSAACGTTLTDAPRSSGNASFGVSSAGDSSAATDAGTGPAAILPGGAAGGAGSAATSSVGGSTVGSGSSAGSAPANGARVPAGGHQPVELGVYSASSAYVNSAEKGLGNSNAGFVDTTAMWKAVVNDVNAHGGFLGHPVQAVVHEQDFSSQADLNADAQAACTAFTQDHHVVGVVSLMFFTTQVGTCLQKAGVPFVGGNLGSQVGRSDAELARLPLFSMAAQVTWDHVAQLWVDQLVAMNYFSPWDAVNGGPGAGQVKIATIATDDPFMRDVVQKMIVPALASHGLKVADPYFMPFDIQALPQNEQSAVLKLRSDGITHALLVDAVGTFFPSSAESQHYRPRYGINTRDALNVFGNALPAAQMRGALGLGWAPPSDVRPGAAPPVSSAGNACLALMKNAGQDPNADLVRFDGMAMCESTWLLRAAFELGGGVTAQAYLTGLGRIGTSFAPVQTFGVLLNASRREGANAARRMLFDDGCACWRYQGANVAIP